MTGDGVLATFDGPARRCPLRPRDSRRCWPAWFTGSGRRPYRRGGSSRRRRRRHGHPHRCTRRGAGRPPPSPGLTDRSRRHRRVRYRGHRSRRTRSQRRTRKLAPLRRRELTAGRWRRGYAEANTFTDASRPSGAGSARPVATNRKARGSPVIRGALDPPPASPTGTSCMPSSARTAGPQLLLVSTSAT